MVRSRKLLAMGVSVIIVTAVLFGLNCYQHRFVGRVSTQDQTAARIVSAAKSQIGNGYDASYRVIPYPGGDVPAGRGACTDVVIRALRPVGFDLQRRVHEDMEAHLSAYPHARNGALDPSIDHRRVPNLACYFSRKGQALTTEVSPRTEGAWQPGDIVCWKVFWNRDHIGIVSDAVDATGAHFVIHNEGKCVEENCLTKWHIVGHYRIAQSGPTNDRHAAMP